MIYNASAMPSLSLLIALLPFSTAQLLVPDLTTSVPTIPPESRTLSLNKSLPFHLFAYPTAIAATPAQILDFRPDLLTRLDFFSFSTSATQTDGRIASGKISAPDWEDAKFLGPYPFADTHVVRLLNGRLHATLPRHPSIASHDSAAAAASLDRDDGHDRDRGGTVLREPIEDRKERVGKRDAWISRPIDLARGAVLFERADALLNEGALASAGHDGDAAQDPAGSWEIAHNGPELGYAGMHERWSLCGRDGEKPRLCFGEAAEQGMMCERVRVFGVNV